MLSSPLKVTVRPAKLRVADHITKGFVINYNGITIPIAYRTSLPGILVLKDLDNLENLYLINKTLCKLPGIAVMTDTKVRVITAETSWDAYTSDHAPKRYLDAAVELFDKLVLHKPVLPRHRIVKASKLGQIVKDSNKKEYLTGVGMSSFREVKVENLIDATGLVLEIDVPLSDSIVNEAKAYVELVVTGTAFIHAKDNLVAINE